MKPGIFLTAVLTFVFQGILATKVTGFGCLLARKPDTQTGMDFDLSNDDLAF